mmetsp:Transcript_25490/g.41464  ORF Transcript_25490/g.41464 Transcript_25490/m.41464 type:complete len:226 (+) Transcript_25490:465-1142(+)
MNVLTVDTCFFFDLPLYHANDDWHYDMMIRCLSPSTFLLLFIIMILSFFFFFFFFFIFLIKHFLVLVVVIFLIIEPLSCSYLFDFPQKLFVNIIIFLLIFFTLLSALNLIFYIHIQLFLLFVFLLLILHLILIVTHWFGISSLLLFLSAHLGRGRGCLSTTVGIHRCFLSWLDIILRGDPCHLFLGFVNISGQATFSSSSFLFCVGLLFRCAIGSRQAHFLPGQA